MPSREEWRAIFAREQQEIREAKLYQESVWHKSHGRCWYCGVQTGMSYATSPTQFTVDHLVPRKKGGTDEISNLVPSCRSCNSRKGVRTVEEFRVQEARRHLPLFTPDHIAYLQRLGIILPKDFPCYSPVVFWFEDPRKTAVDADGWQAELVERVAQARHTE